MNIGGQTISAARGLLAIDGGEPVRSEPPPAWPSYADDEVSAVADVLRSGKVNQWTGDLVRAFESEFARWHGARRAVAVANGTVALEIALRAFGIGPGDQVIVTPRSFMASATCVSLVGAETVFADVDPVTQVLTPSSIAARIGPATRAVVPVHLYGQPCDMPGIMSLAREHGLKIIEDCAQCVGGRIGGRALGTFGDAAAYSFCQDKIISTGGEGGMILTDDDEAWSRMWSFKDHGKSHDLSFAPTAVPGYRWLHTRLGTNARMTEMQAAIGLSQLAKLQEWIASRNAIARRLAVALAPYPWVKVQPAPADSVHARYRLAFTVDEKGMRPGWTRDRLMLALNAEGIAANVGVCPELYREAFFEQTGLHPCLPAAQALSRTSLVLFTHPTIDERYLSDCEAAIHKVFAVASL